MTNYTVLAADDEKELLEVLELYLAKDHIKVLKAASGTDALTIFREQSVHLVLLDIMMPGMDGYGVLREIRKESNVPAIMISARDTGNDKILGLELGADDYITKPFDPMEVAARVKAQLRRSYQFTPLESELESLPQLTLFDLVLNQNEGTLTKGGNPITLTSTEYHILSLLMTNPGRIFTKKQIYETVWQDYYVADDSSLLVHMSNLRNKIEDDSKTPRILKTVKGLGYKVERGGYEK